MCVVRSVTLLAILLELFTTAALGDDFPPPNVLEAIFPKSVPATPEQPLQIKIVPLPGAPSVTSCPLKFGQLQEIKGPTNRTFDMFVDRFGSGSSGPTRVFVNLQRMTVDADGSARAYHPDDPLGEGVCKAAPENKADPWTGICAVDKLSSAEIHIFEGTSEIPADSAAYRARWLEMWNRIKARELKPIDLQPLLQSVPDRVVLYYQASPQISVVFRNTEIIPFKDAFPCMRSDAPKGYFVAGTSKVVGTSSDVCDANRYLDAMQIPFFVIPSGVFANIHVGDIAIGYAKVGEEDRYVFGIVGDKGNVARIGEASIAFSGKLLKRLQTPMNASNTDNLDIDLSKQPDDRRAELKGFKTLSVLLLGGTAARINDIYTPKNIEDVGRAVIKDWAKNGDYQKLLSDCAADISANPRAGTLR